MWAHAGHEVAWQQFPVSVGTPPQAPIESSRLPAIAFTETDDWIRIRGRAFSVQFNRLTGTLDAYVVDGRDRIVSGPILQAYRAITSNDKAFGNGRAKDWHRAGLDRLTRTVRKVTIDAVSSHRVRLTVRADSTTPHDAGFHHHATWTVRGDRSLDLDSRFEPFGALPVLPRIGLVMACPGSFEHLTWYGRGPHENYIDRCQSTDMGIWTSTVTDQYVPYPRPQETGTKTNVQWLCLTNSQGQGLMVCATQSKMAMSALHYTVGDLDHAQHTHELQPRDTVILSLDARHSGLGNGSCGPGVLPQYEIPPEATRLQLRFHPCASRDHKDIARAARQTYRDGL